MNWANNWTAAETNTHQDHVIAHVVGATPLGHFIEDETVYIVLDIGFIWNIFLDMEMGLVPHSVAISELEVDESEKRRLRSYVDELMAAESAEMSPIQSVEFFADGEERGLIINCERERVIIDTSLTERWTRIETD